MKVIKIIHENATPIEVKDEDKTEFSSYTEKLAKLLEASNVTILETSSGSVIIRPSKICSIFVSELNNGEVVEEEIKVEPIEENEDLVTDGE